MTLNSSPNTKNTSTTARPEPLIFSKPNRTVKLYQTSLLGLRDANVIQAVRNAINDVVVRRLEGRMKQARHRAYQFHYEAAMSKVLHEEARKKEAAREAKKNKKRKLLPVVEDPVVKIDRKKGKGKRKPTSTTTAEGEEVGHTGFVIRLKGNLKPDDSMELDDVDSGRR